MTKEVRPTSPPELHHLKELARQGFARDLPHLVQDHLGCWAAYHGDRRIAIARHSGEVHQACRGLQLPLDEVMLFEVTVPDDEVPFGPMSFD